MNGNCHMLFGGTVGVVSAINIDLINQTLPNIPVSTEMKTLLILGCVTGSILPDIDSYGSHTGKLFYPIPQMIDAVLKIDGKDRFKHRGITHSVLLYVGLLLWAYFKLPSVVGIIVGCLTHLFLDAFNPQGVPLLAMAMKTKIRFARIKSGSAESVVLTAILMTVTIMLGIYLKIGG